MIFDSGVETLYTHIPEDKTLEQAQDVEADDRRGEEQVFGDLKAGKSLKERGVLGNGCRKIKRQLEGIPKMQKDIDRKFSIGALSWYRKVPYPGGFTLRW